MVTLIILAVVVVVNFFVSAACLQLGARLVGSSEATFQRALLATLLITVLTCLLQGLALLVAYLNVPIAVIGLFVGLILLLVLSWKIIERLFEITFWRAALAWLGSQVSTGVIGLVAALLLRAYVIEAFRVPTNAMAPAIVGEHYQGVCPHCGETSIVPASAVRRFASEEDESPYTGICMDCLRTGKTDLTSPQEYSGDRIIAHKLVEVRRWDLIVFRYPQDPSQTFVMRLVGLPGENLFVRDGKIWANGKPLEAPEHLRGLVYVTEIEEGTPVDYGTEEWPIQLREDEYCVLGDFSEYAADSRFWGPVPHENLIGVATVLYWPPERWKIWR